MQTDGASGLYCAIAGGSNEDVVAERGHSVWSYDDFIFYARLIFLKQANKRQNDCSAGQVLRGNDVMTGQCESSVARARGQAVLFGNSSGASPARHFADFSEAPICHQCGRL